MMTVLADVEGAPAVRMGYDDVEQDRQLSV